MDTTLAIAGSVDHLVITDTNYKLSNAKLSGFDLARSWGRFLLSRHSKGIGHGDSNAEHRSALMPAEFVPTIYILRCPLDRKL